MKKENESDESGLIDVNPGLDDIMVGYVGTNNIYVSQRGERVLIFTHDHADPGACFDPDDPGACVEWYGGGMLGAWRKAAAFVRKHGGMVVNAPPARPRRPRRPDLKVWENKVLETPWGDPTEFKNRRKAKAYARRHRRQIAEAWDY